MKPVSEWRESDVLSLPVVELDHFEVKGRRALDLSLARVDENTIRPNMTKALSAFANSGGGQIVYGLQDTKISSKAKSWLVDDGGVATHTRKGDTREWLESVIPQLVDFPLIGYNVHAIAREDSFSQIWQDRAIHVVDIPDSDAAPHQSVSDGRYYARVGGRSQPIGHRLVLDIMGRRTDPVIELEFAIELRVKYITKTYRPGQARETVGALQVCMRNTGRTLAHYVNARLLVPLSMMPEVEQSFLRDEAVQEEGGTYHEVWLQNTSRDMVGTFAGEYGPSWFDLILPGMDHCCEVRVSRDMTQEALAELDGSLRWTVYSDNAAPREGLTHLADVELTDKR